MSENIIVIGAGGHGKVIADIVIKSGDKFIGFLDDNFTLQDTVLGYPVLGKIEDIHEFNNKPKFVIGIGNNHIRKQISEKYSNIEWHTVIHPSAIVGMDVVIGDGTVIMACAVVNPSVRIGNHSIINTGAIVEHDNNISDYVHISPNVSMGGTVYVGELTHIGIGAVVKNNISVVAGSVVGAGAVVVKDITEKGGYVGVPAKRVN